MSLSLCEVVSGGARARKARCPETEVREACVVCMTLTILRWCRRSSGYLQQRLTGRNALLSVVSLV